MKALRFILLLGALGLCPSSRFFAVAGQNQPAPAAVTDREITAQIKGAFAADALIKAGHISVKTKKGIVYLKGRVFSQAAKDRAVAIAKGTKGVKRIILTIYVKP